MQNRNSIVLFALVSLVIAAMAVLGVSNCKRSGSTSDRAKNETELNRLLLERASITTVEAKFGKGVLLTNAVDEIRMRSFVSEREANVSKAVRYSKSIQYPPLFGNSWDLIVYVFYDKKNEMAGYCFGGQ